MCLVFAFFWSLNASFALYFQAFCGFDLSVASQLHSFQFGPSPATFPHGIVMLDRVCSTRKLQLPQICVFEWCARFFELKACHVATR